MQRNRIWLRKHRLPRHAPDFLKLSQPLVNNLLHNFIQLIQTSCLVIMTCFCAQVVFRVPFSNTLIFYPEKDRIRNNFSAGCTIGC